MFLFGLFRKSDPEVERKPVCRSNNLTRRVEQQLIAAGPEAITEYLQWLDSQGWLFEIKDD